MKSKMTLRLLLAGLLAGLLAAVLTPSAVAQKAAQAAEEAKDGVRDLVLPSGDGWPIHCTYFESSAGKESACVILLTSTAGDGDASARNRRVWQPTAVELQKAGFAVITVDLRKHGDSIPVGPDGNPLPVKMVNADYPIMASGDLGSVKAFLLSEHQREACAMARPSKTLVVDTPIPTSPTPTNWLNCSSMGTSTASAPPATVMAIAT